MKRAVINSESDEERKEKGGGIGLKGRESTSSGRV